mmetsp:Transcript_102766/g.286207  ORF Transcript_102766/g.286207 Transcript_102766/m.286207 type:complete len:107 (-) Transcript_102766:179-499(-)
MRLRNDTADIRLPHDRNDAAKPVALEALVAPRPLAVAPRPPALEAAARQGGSDSAEGDGGDLTGSAAEAVSGVGVDMALARAGCSGVRSLGKGRLAGVTKVRCRSW